MVGFRDFFVRKIGVRPGEFTFVCELRNPARKILDIPGLTPDSTLGAVISLITRSSIRPCGLRIQNVKRVHSPMIVSQTGSWTGATPLGGTFSYNVGLYNPDPISAIWLFTHVWVGSGNVDPVTGTFLLNVDTRFPRLTQPAFAGLTLASHASTTITFNMKVPSTVEKTNYLGNCCLMQFNWHDIGTYLDRSVFVFTVS